MDDFCIIRLHWFIFKLWNENEPKLTMRFFDLKIIRNFTFCKVVERENHFIWDFVIRPIILLFRFFLLLRPKTSIFVTYLTFIWLKKVGKNQNDRSYFEICNFNSITNIKLNLFWEMSKRLVLKNGGKLDGVYQKRIDGLEQGCIEDLHKAFSI